MAVSDDLGCRLRTGRKSLAARASYCERVAFCHLPGPCLLVPPSREKSGSAGARREDLHEQVVRQVQEELCHYRRVCSIGGLAGAELETVDRPYPSSKWRPLVVLLIPAGTRGRARQSGRAVQLPRVRYLGHEEIAQLPREPERNGIPPCRA
eukprot:scaffold65795_cov60-Phaeocystis_antarctica.AAC.4